jgi:hypothetical protein
MAGYIADKESFVFTYSAKQQKEVEKIRNKYLPKEENKMEQLKDPKKMILWMLIAIFNIKRKA